LAICPDRDSENAVLGLHALTAFVYPNHPLLTTVHALPAATRHSRSSFYVGAIFEGRIYEHPNERKMHGMPP
jgi:hypothetical protein